MIRLIFHIGGMHCSGCAVKIEQELLKLPDIHKARVSFLRSKASVTGMNIDQHRVFHTVTQLGYVPGEASLTFDEEPVLYKKLFLVSLFCSLPVVIGGMIFHHSFVSHLLQGIFSTIVLIYCGKPFFISALKQIRYLYTGMDTLISIGAGSAYLYSLMNLIQGSQVIFFETSSVILTFVLYGKYVESKIKILSSGEFNVLKNRDPKEVDVLRGSEKIRVLSREIQKGDIVKSLPGDMIIVDGKILSGEAEIDESTITGESMPMLRTKGNPVYTGMINLNGSLDIQVEKETSQSLMAQIVESAEEAQFTKPAFQKLADKISSYFVPLVIVIALITFWIHYFMGTGITHAFLSGIAVLVVSCPCALGLATPIVTQLAITAALKKGIVLKDLSVFEEIINIKTLVLDKTGTLTEGKPVVSEFISLTQNPIDLEYIYSLELESNHPVSYALTTFLNNHGYGVQHPVTNVIYITGKALTGDIDNHYIEVSRVSYALETLSPKIDIHPYLQKLMSGQGSEIIASVNQIPVGIFKIQDQLRPHAKVVIDQLKQWNMNPIICSGDSQQNTEFLAHQLDIQNFYYETSPLDKKKLILEFQKTTVTGMVGDGINDTAALAEADVGFAILGRTDIVTQHSHVILLNPDIRGISFILNLSHRVYGLMKQNLFLAFVYNIFAIPFAACGMMHPMVASFMMMMSSLVVVANSLRLYAECKGYKEVIN